MTQVNDGTTSVWTFREISGNPPNIALQHTLANSPVVCQHVLSAVSNVVLDVNVCAPRDHQSSQANRQRNGDEDPG